MALPEFRFRSQEKNDIESFLCRDLVCGRIKNIVLGAQTERRGEATRPVRILLRGWDSPADFVVSVAFVMGSA